MSDNVTHTITTAARVQPGDLIEHPLMPGSRRWVFVSDVSPLYSRTGHPVYKMGSYDVPTLVLHLHCASPARAVEIPADAPVRVR
jgi:hypothetical protein